jgi:hypothetical protein
MGAREEEGVTAGRYHTLANLPAQKSAISFATRVTKEKIQTASDEGIPFVIKMADGEKYEVTDRYRIALGNTTVILVGPDDMPHLLPLLTMAGISHLKSKK